jgi:DHA3 family macrolide efflux protein-like MFS transporter
MQTAGTSLLRNRNFLLVWGGQSVSMLGSRVSYIALMWWVLEKTDSAAAIAVVGITAALPSLLLGPIAGACIDRVDRRSVMIAVNAINGLLVGAAGVLLVSQALQVWEVYLLTVLSSTAMAFHAGGSLLFAAFPSPRTLEGQGWRTILEDTVGGFRFLRANKTLLFMMLLFGLINFLLAPTSVLFPIMARDVLRAGAEGFGLLSAAVSAGMLLGGLMTASLKRFKRYGLAVIWGLVAVGALLALFGISRNLLLSLGVLAILGVFVAVVNVFESVIFQTRVPNDLQGRVFAAQFAICDGLQPVSLAAIGGLLVLVSAPAVLVGSGVAVVMASFGGFAVRGMKEL